MESHAHADPGARLQSGTTPLQTRLRQLVPTIVQRAPPQDDANRWIRLVLGGRQLRLAQPLTFTPYASARPCSARCRFCSENLRTLGQDTAAARLRPGPDYFDALRRALGLLHGVPMSWSLSGLESTDDPVWFLQLLDTLAQAERDGVRIEQRVLYSNGAGFAREGCVPASALGAFGLSWIELSRHHRDDAINDSIMRFRPGEPVAHNAGFVRVARALADVVPLRLICIVQRGGVANARDVAEHIAWAGACGADTVIFREFSRLDARYANNGTRRYIDEARVPMDALLEDCMAAPWWPSLTPLDMTDGYYFWNLHLRTSGGVDVIFEASDYAAMEHRHASGDVYKLVFFADGRLCSGWDPERNLLWDARRG